MPNLFLALNSAAIVPSGNPGFAMVGDSITQFGNNAIGPSLVASAALTRDALGMITVSPGAIPTAHGLIGRPYVFLANVPSGSVLGDTFVRYGQIEPNNDTNSFFLQTINTGSVANTTGGSNCTVIIENQFKQRGHWMWLNSNLKGAGRFLGNYGQGGAMARDNRLAVATDQAIAQNPDVVILEIGINDIGGGLDSAATVTANIKLLVDRITTAGKRCIVVSITPVDHGYPFWSGSYNTKVQTTNSNMSAYCALSPANRLFVDCYTGAFDPTAQSGVGEAFTWVTADGIHWTSRMAKFVGDQIFAAFTAAAWYPTLPTDMLPSAAADSNIVNDWVKFNNVGPWVATGGGTLGSGFSGSGPAGSQWARSLGTGTGVCSIVGPGDGKGYFAQCVFTAVGTNEAIQYYPQGSSTKTLATLGLKVGDTIAVGCEVNVSNAQAATFAGFGLTIQKNGGNVLTYCGVSNEESVSGRTADSYNAYLFTGPAVIASDVTGLVFSIEARFNSAAPCTIQIRRMTMYKVNAPSEAGIAQVGLSLFFPKIDYAFMDVLRYGNQVWKASNFPAEQYSVFSSTGYPASLPSGATSMTASFNGQVADPNDGYGGKWIMDWDNTITVQSTGTVTAPVGGSVSMTTIDANTREYTITGPTIGANFDGTAVITGITTGPTKFRFYRKAYQAALNAGKQWDPAFIAFYRRLGRIRFMDWQNTNDHPNIKWEYRNLPTNFSQRGININSYVYCGLCTQTKGDCTTAISIPGNGSTIVTNPGAWTHGMIVQCYIPTSLPYTNLQSITLGATTSFASSGHTFVVGDWIQFANGVGGGSGALATSRMLGSNAYQISAISAGVSFDIAVNSSTWNGTSPGNGVRYALRLFCGSLPVKVVTHPDNTGAFGINGIGGKPHTFVYEASLDKLMRFDCPAGDGTGTPFGCALETLIDMANAFGKDVQPWFCIPHMADDAYVTNMLTMIRDNLNPQIKFCLELSNECWNSASGFTVTNYYSNLADIRWGYQSDRTRQYNSYYGYRYRYIMRNLLATAFSGQMSRVIRMMGIHISDVVAPPGPWAYEQYRFQCSPEGYVSGDWPINYADYICGAPYYKPSAANWDADQIWNVMYSGVPATISTGLDYIDGRFRSDASGQSMTAIVGAATPPFSGTNGQFYYGAAMAARYSIGYTMYEGSSAEFVNPTFINNPSHGYTVTTADYQAAVKVYYDSTQYGQFLTDAISGFLQVGGVYPSQYVMTNSGHPFALLWPNRQTAVLTSAYYAFRNFNGK